MYISCHHQTALRKIWNSIFISSIQTMYNNVNTEHIFTSRTNGKIGCDTMIDAVGGRGEKYEKRSQCLR
jgi:hypothetical protein